MGNAMGDATENGTGNEMENEIEIATENAEEEGVGVEEREDMVGNWRRVKKLVGGWMKELQSKWKIVRGGKGGRKARVGNWEGFSEVF